MHSRSARYNIASMMETVVSLSVEYHFNKCHVYMPWIHQSDFMAPTLHRTDLLLVGTGELKLYVHHCMIGVTRQTPHCSAPLNIRSILLNPDTESQEEKSRYRMPVSSVWMIVMDHKMLICEYLLMFV